VLVARGVQHLDPMILIGLSSRISLDRCVMQTDVHGDGQMTVG
jgi:hypothetical protein